MGRLARARIRSRRSRRRRWRDAHRVLVEALVGDLDRLMQHRTTILVAHRLSPIRNASWIFVLEEGCLVESGTERELLAGKGLYSQFHGLQWGVMAAGQG